MRKISPSISAGIPARSVEGAATTRHSIASNTASGVSAANGCRACRSTGYRGRTAIQELMLMDDEVRSLVMQKADAATIRRACTAHGMTLLRQNGAQRILLGETTVEELLRVTQEDIL